MRMVGDGGHSNMEIQKLHIQNKPNATVGKDDVTTPAGLSIFL